MKIYCLFAQQQCDYADQYAPDLRGAIDEWGNDENPDYLNDLEKKLRSDTSIAFFRRMTIEIDDAQFDRLFFPPTETLKGSIN